MKTTPFFPACHRKPAFRSAGHHPALDGHPAHVPGPRLPPATSPVQEPPTGRRSIRPFNAAPSFALANDNPPTVDQDGWCLIAPFGEWPKTRVYREAGAVKTQHYLQVLDNESAEALVSSQNSFFSRLKRAFVGVPVYKGHGDLADIDPQAVANSQPKLKVGVVDQLRKTARGVEAHFALDNDGLAAVAAGCKFPSGFWYVKPLEDAPVQQSIIRCRPTKLISVALTDRPNISGVESLANAELAEPPALEPPANTLKNSLVGLAIGANLTLDPDPTDDQILRTLADALRKPGTKDSRRDAALNR